MSSVGTIIISQPKEPSRAEITAEASLSPVWHIMNLLKLMHKENRSKLSGICGSRRQSKTTYRELVRGTGCFHSVLPEDSGEKSWMFSEHHAITYLPWAVHFYRLVIWGVISPFDIILAHRGCLSSAGQCLFARCALWVHEAQQAVL